MQREFLTVFPVIFPRCYSMCKIRKGIINRLDVKAIIEVMKLSNDKARNAQREIEDKTPPARRKAPQADKSKRSMKQEMKKEHQDR